MSDSKDLQDAMRNGWVSRHLRYRAAEDNETDRAFYHNLITGDPVGFALGCPDAFRPQARSLTDSYFDSYVKKQMLAVVICLPTDEVSELQKSDNSETTESSCPNGKAKEDASPWDKTVSIGLLTLGAAGPEHYQHRDTDLGIYIIDGYRGKGFGPEAIDWALDWAFKFAGMHRVSLSCNSYNDRARRVYEKLGFVQEGAIREAVWFNRGWHDRIFYGMLESEWEKLRSSERLS